MTAITTESGDSQVEAYEQLRRGFLPGSLPTNYPQRTLLLREGIAAWLAQRSTVLQQKAPLPPSAGKNGAPLTDANHADIVRVLVNMALGNKREMST